VIVGRNAQTKLKNFRLSRKHASLVANDKEEKIVFNQIGANTSFFSRKNSSEGESRKTHLFFWEGQNFRGGG
jgi:hypothetical protein